LLIVLAGHLTSNETSRNAEPPVSRRRSVTVPQTEAQPALVMAEKTGLSTVAVDLFRADPEQLPARPARELPARLDREVPTKRVLLGQTPQLSVNTHGLQQTDQERHDPRTEPQRGANPPIWVWDSGRAPKNGGSRHCRDKGKEAGNVECAVTHRKTLGTRLAVSRQAILVRSAPAGTAITVPSPVP
jgi:hypothetical protein